MPRMLIPFHALSNAPHDRHDRTLQFGRASVYGTEGCWFEPSGVYWLVDPMAGRNE